MSICATIGKPIITNMDVCIHDGFIGFSELNGIIGFHDVYTTPSPSIKK